MKLIHVGILAATMAVPTSVCLAQTPAAPPAAAPVAVKLAYQYQKGTASPYHVSLDVSTGQGGAQVSQNYVSTISDVAADGGFSQILHWTKEVAILGGSPTPLPIPPDMTLSFDNLGKLLTVKTPEADPTMSVGVSRLLIMADRIILPPNPVAVNGTWTTEMDDPQVKGAKVTFTGTYLGMEVRGGKSYWKVKQQMKAPVAADGTTMTSTGTALLDPATGQLVHETGTIENLPTAAYGVLTAQVTVNLAAPKSAAGTASSAPTATPTGTGK